MSPPQIEELNENTSFLEIEWAVKKLKRNKSPGIDMVTSEMIQASGPEWVDAFQNEKLEVNGEELQNVEEFTYLGSTITYDPDCMRDITLRFAKAKSVLMALGAIWKSKDISYGSKVDILI